MSKKPRSRNKPVATGEKPTAAPATEAVATDAKTRKHFPIVGIGASAGGLEALQELFQNMPTDTGAGFVVVTHQHPDHQSLLAELLSRETGMPVVNAVDGQRVEPNHVYVETPGSQLAILNGVLHKMGVIRDDLPRLPIDYFFRSLAQDQQGCAVGIILSGTGSDGTLGCRAIKAASGLVIAQDPASARYNNMPANMISAGLADFVLAPAGMHLQLTAYISSGQQIASGSEDAAVENDTPSMHKILLLMRDRTGHDFSGYKANSLTRRIERRMKVHQITRTRHYVRYLQENPHELDLLFQELLIGVTNFFRDEKAWEALVEPLDALLSSAAETGEVRVWVAGCHTGEEAYSIAILIRERMEALNLHFKVQVFATDIDEEALTFARGGHYPDGIAVDVPAERLARDFQKEAHGYRIHKAIRDMLIFATQNVTRDPPFTRLDMVICRNLMIYLDAELQKRLMPIIHYAIRPNGLLFLGSAESVGGFSELFTPLDQRWRIYQRIGVPYPLPPQTPVFPPASRNLPPRGQNKPAPPLSAVIERMLLARFAPVSVVANTRGDIVYIHGRSGDFLEPNPGQPRNNLLDMAREGLCAHLATAIRSVTTDGQPVERTILHTQRDGNTTPTRLTVCRMDEPVSMRGLLLVTFTPVADETGNASAGVRPTIESSTEQTASLEAELRYMKETQQATQEELESANEELRSINEEMQSTNEELQSTNEELETSREEMQSLNEELSSVNVELHLKVEALSQANDDMQNLLNSADVATVFLDTDLQIRRYTEQAQDLIRLRPGDIGRPISELACTLLYEQLVADCRATLKHLKLHEQEVRTESGTHYLMRILPYRTRDNVVDGLALTFVNINRLKESQQRLEVMAWLFSRNSNPILVIDSDGTIIEANLAALQLLTAPGAEIIGSPVARLFAAPAREIFARDLQNFVTGNRVTDAAYAMNQDLWRNAESALSMSRLSREDGSTLAVGLTLLDVADHAAR